MTSAQQPSHRVARNLLNTLLNDFGVYDNDQLDKLVVFRGDVPSLAATRSEHLLLSLIGAIPAAANAYVAAQIFALRGGQNQTVTVDLRRGHNYIDPNVGMTPTVNGQEITLDLVMGNPFLRNIFETRDGRYVVPSAVYVDLAYQWSAFLSCSMNENDIREAFKKWDSGELEATCAEAGLPLAIVRSTEEWLQTSQGKHLAEKSIVPIQKVTSTPPRMLSSNPDRPLEGVRVLCLTHAIAGPSAGRTLAEHGASVLQIMYTHGFEHSFVYTYANLGCASSRLNLHKEQDRQHLWTLIRDADVWIDSYRDGALSKFGFGYAELHQANPYLIISKVRAYGSTGPWASRPGFDMQGSAVSGMMALCGAGPKSPAWPPGMVINDYTTGYYGALAIQSALIRRMKEGGGYILSPSLAGTAMSIVKYFQTSDYPELIQSADEALPPEIIEGATNLGYLRTLKPLPILQHTPIKYDPILLNAMGTDLPLFPGTKAKFDLRSVQPFERKALLAQWEAFSRRLENVKRLGKRDVI